MPAPLRPPSRRFSRPPRVLPTFATPFGRGRPTIGGGQLEYRWRGRKVIEAMLPAITRAIERAKADAYTYWRDVIWFGPPNPNHPYMTGKEREAGRFDVIAEGEPLRVTLRGSVDLEEEYPVYEEFGTSRQEGHFPLRRTMDWTAPRIRGYVREELAADT